MKTKKTKKTKKPEKPKKLYKFLRTGLKSENGEDRDWKIGEWRKEEKLKICKRGFHASKTPLQALGYVCGEVLALVEVRGKSIVRKDKECWSEMRIVKAWHWKKEDSVALAIFSAEQVLHLYEKKYPNDPRPRNAIEAAKKWLAEPTEQNMSAAWAAAAEVAAVAEAARAAAEEAAWVAAWAARAAARAAEAEVAAAAWAARAAAEEAARAARAAARAAIDKWFLAHIKTLESYE